MHWLFFHAIKQHRWYMTSSKIYRSNLNVCELKEILSVTFLKFSVKQQFQNFSKLRDKVGKNLKEYAEKFQR